MRATKKLVKIGANLYFPLTSDLREYLSIDEDNIIVEWQDEEGKHGRYISFWKKKEQLVSEEDTNENQ